MFDFFFQDISQHTRVTPNQRKQAMSKFIQNIYSKAEAVEELRSWGLELDKDLMKVIVFYAHVNFLEQCSILVQKLVCSIPAKSR